MGVCVPRRAESVESLEVQYDDNGHPILEQKIVSL
jgi:hypothetical protein